MEQYDIKNVIIVFFKYKNRKQEGRTGPVWGIVPVGEGKKQGKGVRG
jgi:hypothetical protein